MHLKELSKIISGKTAEDGLKELSMLFPGQGVFTTSFGLEDQVITHMIFAGNLDIEVITLDTGRLFPETYKTFNETVKKYRKQIRVFFPDNSETERMVTEKGPYSFYYSTDNRHECCRIRKVEPLNRALREMKCWVTGIRAEQSENRHNMEVIEYDENKALFKYHPLFGWSLDEVKSFIRENSVPYNSLHDKGFVSIGCEPCTRAVKEGENFRAGRWWWENGSQKECGLHMAGGTERGAQGKDAEP